MGISPRGIKNNYVGIEIEFVSKFGVRDCNTLLKKLRMSGWCDAVHDCSIEDEYGWELKANPENEEYDDEPLNIFGVELRILSTEKDLSAKLIKVKKFLKLVAHSVNQTCGLHVHLDMRNRPLETCVLNLLKHQHTFRNMVPSWRRESCFCAPLDVESLYYTGEFNPDHGDRTDINVNAYMRHQTVEVRIHEGTLDMREIYNWTQYLITICDGKEQHVNKRYVKRRISTHASVC